MLRCSCFTCATCAKPKRLTAIPRTCAVSHETWPLGMLAAAMIVADAAMLLLHSRNMCKTEKARITLGVDNWSSCTTETHCHLLLIARHVTATMIVLSWCIDAGTSFHIHSLLCVCMARESWWRSPWEQTAIEWARVHYCSKQQQEWKNCSGCSGIWVWLKLKYNVNN